MPFCVAGLGDLLALFRCISCRFAFGTDVKKVSQLGAPGRVFTSSEVRRRGGAQHAVLTVRAEEWGVACHVSRAAAGCGIGAPAGQRPGEARHLAWGGEGGVWLCIGFGREERGEAAPDTALLCNASARALIGSMHLSLRGGIPVPTPTHPTPHSEQRQHSCTHIKTPALTSTHAHTSQPPRAPALVLTPQNPPPSPTHTYLTHTHTHWPQPELACNVQKYSKTAYLRKAEAEQCQVQSTLLLPVFLTPARHGCVGVLEVVQTSEDMHFTEMGDLIGSVLEVGLIRQTRFKE